MVHENSGLCTSVVGRGTQTPPRGAALQERFHHAPIAGTSRQLQGRARPEDRLEPRMRLPNGARRHPRLQREGPRRPRCEVLASQENPRRLRPRERRVLEGDAPPLPEGVRALLEPVDFGDGRRCRLRGRAHDGARLGGDRPGYFVASAFGEVDASPRRWITSPDPLYERKKGGATD
jgi:hypothetical protein